MVKHGKVSPSASVRTQHKKDGRGVLVVESDAEDVSLAGSTGDTQGRGKSSSSLSASAKKRRKAERRAAVQQHVSLFHSQSLKVMTLTRRLNCSVCWMSKRHSQHHLTLIPLWPQAVLPRFDLLALVFAWRLFDLDAREGDDLPPRHASLLVTPGRGMAPQMAPDPVPQAQTEVDVTTDGHATTPAVASSPAAPMDLAQLHVSLLQVVNQAITHTLQPVLSQHQQQLERIDEGQRILQSKMSDGLVSLSGTLSKHGSRLSALEESQLSLSQRLRNLEANPSVSAPSAPDDKDEDMGNGPTNRGRARSSGATSWSTEQSADSQCTSQGDF
eukprot:3048255-Amphidinium_carterae.2